LSFGLHQPNLRFRLIGVLGPELRYMADFRTIAEYRRVKHLVSRPPRTSCLRCEEPICTFPNYCPLSVWKSGHKTRKRP
jgi:hypothetical protein